MNYVKKCHRCSKTYNTNYPRSEICGDCKQHKLFTWGFRRPIGKAMNTAKKGELIKIETDLITAIKLMEKQCQ